MLVGLKANCKILKISQKIDFLSLTASLPIRCELEPLPVNSRSRVSVLMKPACSAVEIVSMLY